MNIESSIRSVHNELLKIRTATLVHAENEYCVAPAFAKGDRRAMLDAGYDPAEVDEVVTLDTHQLKDKQQPRPGDRCELDGIGYVIKNDVTNNPVFVSLPLRKIR